MQSMKELTLEQREQQPRKLPPELPVFEGRAVDPVAGAGGSVAGTSGANIIAAAAGSGATRQTFHFATDRVAGNGSFGVVLRATCLETGETVAIKKVLQDKRFKNRELQIMKVVDHPNVVKLKQCFYSTTDKDETFLHLVLEYVPDTAHRVIKTAAKAGRRVPLLHVKLYAYQMLRALGHIHKYGICHRDVKPQNLLVDADAGALKLCDFGSAKALARGEPNISYICSRYYRAPELIFGATEYTTAVDVWAAGCVLAELLLGSPLFPGQSGVDQLVEIIKVLGTPSRDEIRAMNPNYTEFKFPAVAARPWAKALAAARPPADAVDLVSRLLRYAPGARCAAHEALAHPFFDELRQPGVALPNGRPLPPLFDWLPGELDHLPAELVARLQPRGSGGGSGGSSSAAGPS